MELQSQYEPGILEAGLDEAGRGCLAGPVVAAAVILPGDYTHPELNDSKKLSAEKRETLREVIEQDAVAWAVGVVSPEEIDRINILQASFAAMVIAVEALKVSPEALLVDGNRFIDYSIPATCMVKGDSRFLNIAAASVLAKTHRDALMRELHEEHPVYNWQQNKGYPTREHRQAIQEHGICAWHRKSFTLKRSEP